MRNLFNDVRLEAHVLHLPSDHLAIEELRGCWHCLEGAALKFCRVVPDLADERLRGQLR